MTVLLFPFIAIMLMSFVASFRFPATVIKGLNIIYVLFNAGTFILLLSVITGDVVFLHIVINIIKEDLRIGTFHIPRYVLDNYLFSIFVIYFISLGMFYLAFKIARNNKQKRQKIH